MTKQENTDTDSKLPDTSTKNQTSDNEGVCSLNDTAVNADDEKQQSISAKDDHTHIKNSSTVSALSQQTESKTSLSLSLPFEDYGDEFSAPVTLEPQIDINDDDNKAKHTFTNGTKYTNPNAPKTLTRKVHSVLDRVFPEHFGKCPFIDSPFTIEPDDYELLGRIISETLEPESKWLTSTTKNILRSSPPKPSASDKKYADIKKLRDEGKYTEAACPSLQLRLANISGVRIEKDVGMVGNALGFLGEDNEFRKWCYYTANSLFASYLMSFIIFFELGLLTYQMWFPETHGFIHLHKYSWIDYTMIGTNVVYGFFVILRIIAYGFVTERDVRKFKLVEILNFFLVNDWFFASSAKKIRVKPQRESESKKKKKKKKKKCEAFLKSAGNIIDLTGFISFIISTCLGLSGWELKTGILLFRSLMCLKILRIYLGSL
ncbi:unnamed protein product [Ambrosiozyma monospora]|uniref:Unnamed protein product n=1 Tax=Ambrosiozyma monospora TaxID=43982 RepID=A0A9W6YYL4_AMBMO|nr:unnamed protein product [Ambrosiozyma monospora]